ncbi:MAG TPA: methyltransferase domain-containing protein [Afifellaceae bacterium]|nr:methyltransferase domain-containing protein [Afifellaceae bacterium]
MSVPTIVDRQLLRRRFARVARRPGSDCGFLLARAIDDLDLRLSAVERRFGVALALSGFTPDLAERLAGSGKAETVFRMEPAPELTGGGRFATFVADEERLPLAPESVDLVVSALALQFVNDLPGALLQIRRALRPDGLFLASLIGGETLHELRRSFTQAESELRGGAGPRFLPLADVRDLGGLLQRAGFALPVADRDLVTVRYDTAFDLMHDLRAMGAANMLADREKRPLRRDVLTAAAQIYQEHFSDPDGRIRATFEIISLSGWAPHDSQQKPAARGSAQTSLVDVLGRKKHDEDG